MFVVDLVLKNGKGNLVECSIYDSNDRGILPIEDLDKLKSILANKGKWIFFQNVYANGQCHTFNIESYTIKEITREDRIKGVRE